MEEWGAEEVVEEWRGEEAGEVESGQSRALVGSIALVSVSGRAWCPPSSAGVLW